MKITDLMVDTFARAFDAADERGLGFSDRVEDGLEAVFALVESSPVDITPDPFLQQVVEQP